MVHSLNYVRKSFIELTRLMRFRLVTLCCPNSTVRFDDRHAYARHRVSSAEIHLFLHASFCDRESTEFLNHCGRRVFCLIQAQEASKMHNHSNIYLKKKKCSNFKRSQKFQSKSFKLNFFYDGEMNDVILFKWSKYYSFVISCCIELITRPHIKGWQTQLKLIRLSSLVCIINGIQTLSVWSLIDSIASSNCVWLILFI